MLKAKSVCFCVLVATIAISGCATGPRAVDKKIETSQLSPCQKEGHKWDRQTGTCWICGKVMAPRRFRPKPKVLSEDEKILQAFTQRDKFILLAFEKEGVSRFDVSVEFNNYRSFTAEPVSLENFLKYLKDLCVGWQKNENGQVIYKMGISEFAFEKFAEKIRKNYALIIQYEKEDAGR